jgi:oligopeptidase A
MEAWDVAYVSEKLLQARYAFSEQEVKAVFYRGQGSRRADSRSSKGCSAFVSSPTARRLWHADVRFYRIETPTGELIGQFYLDLYARETKRSGAWMDEAISRRKRATAVANS